MGNYGLITLGKLMDKRKQRMDEQIKKRATDDYAKSKQTWPLNGPTFKHFKTEEEKQQHQQQVAEAQKQGASF